MKNFVFDFQNIPITILYFINFQLQNNFKILSKFECVLIYLEYFYISVRKTWVYGIFS